MLGKIRKNNEGFTIIEVLIVLAIAGLIMLIVFLAVPALQRNQRNNARNSDASRISAAITECLANRNGSTATSGQGCGVPANINAGNRTQLGTLTLRSGALSTDAASPSTGGSTTAAEYQFSAICNADGSGAVADTNSKNFVVLFVLETNITRCIGSQSN